MDPRITRRGSHRECLLLSITLLVTGHIIMTVLYPQSNIHVMPKKKPGQNLLGGGIEHTCCSAPNWRQAPSSWHPALEPRTNTKA